MHHATHTHMDIATATLGAEDQAPANRMSAPAQEVPRRGVA